MREHRFGDPEQAAAPDSGLFGFDVPADEAALIIVPVPFDATTSYGDGARDGPRTVLSASRYLDLHDPEIGTPFEQGITMLDEEVAVRDWNAEARAAVERARAATEAHLRAGNARRVDDRCAQLNAWLREQVSAWIDRGRVVGTLGGEHGCVFGAIQAHLAAYPDMGLLHIDAHADLRAAYEGFTWSHASIMRNLIERTEISRLVQVGLRDVTPSEAQLIHESQDRIVALYDRDLAEAVLEGIPFSTVVARAVDSLPRDVYVSFDIDGLDPSLCPNTGTPVPGGLSFHQAGALLASITRSGRRLVGFDLVEIAPGRDDKWDGNVGARILYKLCGHALLNR